MTPALLQPAPGLASYTLGQKTTISERYAQIFQAPIYIVRVVTIVSLTNNMTLEGNVPSFFNFRLKYACDQGDRRYADEV